MGRETKTITVSLQVSRHNSDQDRYDDDAVARLRQEIDNAVAVTRERYPNMTAGYIDVSGP